MSFWQSNSENIVNKHLHGLDFSTMYIQRGNKTEPEKRRGERLRETKGEREREDSCYRVQAKEYVA